MSAALTRPLGVLDAMLLGFTRALTLGRASRIEFWGWMLIAPLLAVAAALADMLMQDTPEPPFERLPSVATVLITLALLSLPAITLTIRRLHDTDHSGLWLLAVIGAWLAYLFVLVAFGVFGAANSSYAVLAVLPLLVMLRVLWLCALPSQPGANRFGPPPASEVPA